MLDFIGTLITQSYDFMCIPISFGNFNISLFNILVFTTLSSMIGYFIGRILR